MALPPTLPVLITQAVTHSLTHSLSHHSVSHSVTHSFSLSLIHSFSHLFTQSSILPLIYKALRCRELDVYSLLLFPIAYGKLFKRTIDFTAGHMLRGTGLVVTVYSHLILAGKYTVEFGRTCGGIAPVVSWGHGTQGEVHLCAFHVNCMSHTCGSTLREKSSNI